MTPTEPTADPFALIHATMRHLAQRGAPVRLTTANVQAVTQAAVELLRAFGVEPFYDEPTDPPAKEVTPAPDPTDPDTPSGN